MARTYGFDHFTTRPRVRPASPRQKKKPMAQKQRGAPPPARKAKEVAPPEEVTPLWKQFLPVDAVTSLSRTLLKFPDELGRFMKRRLFPPRS